MPTDPRRFSTPENLPYGKPIALNPDDRPTLTPELEQRLQQFSQSNKPGVWPHLEKAKLIRQMGDRLRNPFEVSQGGQPFCGPTAILFELLRQQPARYIDICQDLFETGFFQAQTKSISAIERLRHSQGELRMAEADWMLLATLRDAENRIFQVDPNAPEFIQQLSGITKSWEMIGWAKEVLGYGRVRYRHAFVLGDVSALRWAERSLRRGGVAFLLITADGLLKAKALPVTVPNHWIVLLDNVQVTGPRALWWWRSNRQISFEIYSWARRYKIEVPELQFEDLFWGVVTAEPMPPGA